MAVNHAGPNDVLTIISDGPGVVGEELTLGLVKDGEQVSVTVRVIATSLEILDGVVRHRLKVEVLGTEGGRSKATWWAR